MSLHLLSRLSSRPVISGQRKDSKSEHFNLRRAVGATSWSLLVIDMLVGRARRLKSTQTAEQETDYCIRNIYVIRTIIEEICFIYSTSFLEAIIFVISWIFNLLAFILWRYSLHFYRIWLHGFAQNLAVKLATKESF